MVMHDPVATDDLVISAFTAATCPDSNQLVQLLVFPLTGASYLRRTWINKFMFTRISADD